MNANILDAMYRNMIVVNFTVQGLYATKQDRNVEAEIEVAKKAKKGSVSVRKSLIPKVYLDPINKVACSFRNWLDFVSTPGPCDGVKLISTKQYDEVVRRYKEYQIEFYTLVDAALEKYDEMRDEGRASLGDMFKEEDFPTRDQLKRRFVLKATFSPVARVSDAISGLTQEALRDFQADMANEYEDMYTKSLVDILDKVLKRAQHYNERLVGDKTFHDSTVEFFQATVDLLEQYNVADDPRVSAIIEKAKEAAVYSPETVRDSSEAKIVVIEKTKEVIEDINSFKSVLGF